MVFIYYLLDIGLVLGFIIYYYYYISSTTIIVLYNNNITTKTTHKNNQQIDNWYEQIVPRKRHDCMQLALGYTERQRTGVK